MASSSPARGIWIGIIPSRRGVVVFERAVGVWRAVRPFSRAGNHCIFYWEPETSPLSDVYTPHNLCDQYNCTARVVALLCIHDERVRPTVWDLRLLSRTNSSPLQSSSSSEYTRSLFVAAFDQSATN